MISSPPEADVAQAVRTVEAGEQDAGRTVQRLMHDRLGVSNAEAKGLIASGCVARNHSANSKGPGSDEDKSTSASPIAG